MSNLANYRSSTEYREILRILQKSTTDQENILWQSHALSKTVIPVQYIEIDFIAREVLINFNSEHYVIDQDLPLYVKLGYQNNMFKISNYRRTQNSLNFSFPDLIKTPELRLYPRLSFKASQEKFVTLRSSMSSSLKETGNELKVRAIDISEFGLGLIVSETNRSFLKNNRILWVTGLQDMSFSHPVLAEVIYINSEVDPQFQIKKQKSLKVGLKLSGYFQQDIYNRFLQ